MMDSVVGRRRDNKYLVVRRDGSVPMWPHFVLGARDPAAVDALLSYANRAEILGYPQDYVESVRLLAVHFQQYAATHGHGDPGQLNERCEADDVLGVMDGQHRLVRVQPDLFD